MTPKDKAKELVQKFYNSQCSHSITELAYKSAKQCALICVDREKQTIIYFQNNDDIGHYWFLDDKLKELEEVNQEILKL